MGLFYVWIKFSLFSPPITSLPPGVRIIGENKGSRHLYERLVTFANREAADEWWRTISTPPSVHAGKVKRISPQLYVQIKGEPKDDVCTFFYSRESPDTRHFFERMFLTSDVRDSNHNPTTVILPTQITDHISGRWYCIRSRLDPSSHWYLRTSGTCAVCADASCSAIHASSNYRTRFCVRVRNNPQVPEDFVMIGRDEISIAAPKGYTVHIDDGGDLKATKGYQGETDLLFGDLKNRFVARAERQVNGEVWEYVESVERGVGEPWELVGE